MKCVGVGVRACVRACVCVCVCVCVCQEVLRSLHHSQSLLQRQTEALSRAEQELRKLSEEYQVRLPKTQLHLWHHFQLNTKKQLLLLLNFLF